LPLLAFVKALNDRRSPRYQRSLIRESLRKVGVVLLHNVQRCVPGEPAMVLGKQFVHIGKLFVSHARIYRVPLVPSQLSAHYSVWPGLAADWPEGVIRRHLCVLPQPELGVNHWLTMTAVACGHYPVIKSRFQRGSFEENSRCPLSF
jgi:hypothetical protein